MTVDLVAIAKLNQAILVNYAEASAITEESISTLKEKMRHYQLEIARHEEVRKQLVEKQNTLMKMSEIQHKKLVQYLSIPRSREGEIDSLSTACLSLHIGQIWFLKSFVTYCKIPPQWPEVISTDKRELRTFLKLAKSLNLIKVKTDKTTKVLDDVYSLSLEDGTDPYKTFISKKFAISDQGLQLLASFDLLR